MHGDRSLHNPCLSDCDHTGAHNHRQYVRVRVDPGKCRYGNSTHCTHLSCRRLSAARSTRRACRTTFADPVRLDAHSDHADSRSIAYSLRLGSRVRGSWQAAYRGDKSGHRHHPAKSCAVLPGVISLRPFRLPLHLIATEPKSSFFFSPHRQSPSLWGC